MRTIFPAVAVFLTAVLPAPWAVPSWCATTIGSAAAAPPDASPPVAKSSLGTPETMFVTRSLAHPRLIEYLQAARPDIVQVGNYGAMFHAFADNPRSTRTPMMLPVVGERAALKFQKQLNAQVHELGLAVVGHFRLIKVMGDWQEKSGFVDYYNNRWPADLLGPKPHPQLIELLQRDADGNPIQVSRYENAQLTLCLSSPYARRMFKAMLKCAVDHGADGVMTNYNYRFSCACPYCQSAFKSWLKRRLSAAEIRQQLGIDDLDRHTFPTIPARIPGYPDPAESKPLDWLAMRWGAEHFKQMFDDIFVRYGRSLRKDLIVAQWNHLSHVSISEERMFLPLPAYHRDEDYFWYSGGAAFVGRNLNLREGKAGDAWLSCMYVRELTGGKPFVMGKYDGIRLAASMAEGFATGGLGMGRYMRFEEPVGFDVLVQYARFRQQHRGLFTGVHSYADAAIVLPRQSVWNRRPDALDVFRELGQGLVERQVLLDVVADENVNPDRLAAYPAVVLPNAAALSDGQLDALRGYVAQGGVLFQVGDAATIDEMGKARKNARIDGAKLVNFVADATRNNTGTDTASPDNTGSDNTAADAIVVQLHKRGATRVTSPWTVRAAAYHGSGRVVVHLVNYDRDESVDKQLKGSALERPRLVENIRVDLRLPTAGKVNSIRLHRPDQETPLSLEFDQPEGNSRVTFQLPSVLVYGVVSVELYSGPTPAGSSP